MFFCLFRPISMSNTNAWDIEVKPSVHVSHVHSPPFCPVHFWRAFVSVSYVCIHKLMFVLCLDHWWPMSPKLEIRKIWRLLAYFSERSWKGSFSAKKKEVWNFAFEKGWRYQRVVSNSFTIAMFDLDFSWREVGWRHTDHWGLEFSESLWDENFFRWL